MWTHISAKRVLRSLVPQYDSPFEVITRVGAVAYRLVLPERLKLYLIFHVSFLKKFHEDADPEQRREIRVPLEVHVQFDRELAGF